MTDARLLLPALVAWVGTAGALLWLTSIGDVERRHSVANAVVVLALVMGALALAVLWRRPAAFVVVATGTLAVLAVGVQTAGWTSPALQQTFGDDVRVLGRIDGPPRMAVGVTYLPMRTEVIAGKQRFHLDVPVTIAIAEGSPARLDIPVGTPIEVQGRLRHAGGSLNTAAYLDLGDNQVIPTGNASLVDQWAERVRSGLTTSLPSQPSDGSALVAGLAIGDERSMSPQLRDAMRASGLAHLTAVSGGNVAIVVGAVLAIAWLIRLPMVARIVVALVALGFYVVVVHPQPSVLRAGVMGVVVVLSLLVGGRRAGPSVLATAVIVLVVTVPSLALSWGFALSVAATGGIVLLAPLIRERVHDSWLGARLPDAVVIAVSLTIAAQLATAPVLLAMGASVGIVSVPANLLAMPVVPVVTIAGLAAAVLQALGLALVAPIASFIALVGAWTGQWIAQVALVSADVDVLRFQGSVVNATVAVLAAAAAVFAWRRGAAGPLRLAAVLVVIVAVVWWVFPPGKRAWPPADWVMMQCDVGQGDGFVIAGRAGRDAVVVDTGRSAKDIDTCLSDLGIDHIAALVLTHFHADHVAGLAGVLAGRQVDAVLATGWHEPRAQWLGVERLLGERGLVVQRIDAGATFEINEVTYRALWPRRFITTGTLSSGSVANNASVVLEAQVRGLRVLLTGDIEPPAQAAILSEPGGFDLVKIPHHGSPHQHPDFATWADADAAVVSVGEDNEFGHPAPSTLQSWRDSGALVLRTDLHGDVAVVVSPEAGGWRLVPRRGPAH